MGKILPNYVSTTNACKLCKPLGASLAFRGVEGAVPFLHGSQGCATYMRRYIISHFNEPIDIASSALGEKHAVYGGGPNLKLGLNNVRKKYRPKLIGIATTCLTETIGDDVPHLLAEYRRESDPDDKLPLLVAVSTPSYGGTHMEGFQVAVRGVVEQLAQGGEAAGTVNLLPGFVSAADLRYLKGVMADFGLSGPILPDFSDTLDGPALREYPLLPAGGTRLADIAGMGRAAATIELGRTAPALPSAGAWLNEQFAVPLHRLGLPIGLRETDAFFALLAQLAGTVGRRAEGGRPVPAGLAADAHAGVRGRLIDSLVDAHKYVSGKRAVVYGEEDLVVGLASFLAEIGITPVLCASGGKSGRLAAEVAAVTEGYCPEPPQVRDGADFFEIENEAAALKPDLFIGHSKGYAAARRLGIPLVRVGFPIHDRMGGQRLLHLGYHGTQRLFDEIVNTLIAKKQDDSTVGYSYM